MAMPTEAGNTALPKVTDGQVGWAQNEDSQLPEDCISMYLHYSRSARSSADIERYDPHTHSQVNAEQSHSVGFSADQFASYEKRLKSSITRVDTPRIAVIRNKISTTSSDFDLEKGTTKSQYASGHSRTESQTTILSNWTIETINVPTKRQYKLIRNIRHTYLNVYRRLFSIVFIANMIGLIIFLVANHKATRFSLSDLATAASSNICVAVLMRQDYIVNFLFKIFWRVPHSTPLRLRRIVAKVYENGGVHSGSAVAGTIWFILLTIAITAQFVDGILNSMTSIPVLILTYVLVILLITIVILAYPRFRFLSHNTFEYTHRFAGWLAVGLFWVEIMLLANMMHESTGKSMSQVLIHLPTFWILIIITFHIILPWLRLRKWHFNPIQLSTHALRLKFAQNLPPISGLAISEFPLGEWHQFATFPNSDGGGSMIISDAGDWTKRNVLNPRTRYWVRGLPRTGVLGMAFCFRKVIIVTTGSGIGPCLSFLGEPSRKTVCRVLWSTPSPLKTYGHEIHNMVLRADPEAVIINTRESGRPDMVAITYNMFLEAGAEAVFCISNPKLTRKIVYAMETRGIPAYGPVWDS
jgi:hypothetical protein